MHLVFLLSPRPSLKCYKRLTVGFTAALLRPVCGRRSLCGAPWASKSGDLSVLVLMSAYAHLSVRLSVETLGEREGNPKTVRRGEENAIFSWREIARCFWTANIFFLGTGNRCF